MIVQDLGSMPYRLAWERQEAVHARVQAGGEEQVLFVEHPPVITLGRRPGVSQNLVASEERLASLGVDVVQSDRGGDITFHGPGGHRGQLLTLDIPPHSHAVLAVARPVIIEFEGASYHAMRRRGRWHDLNRADWLGLAWQCGRLAR